MNREALNMALQALETLMIERGSIYDKSIIAIREALADPSPNFNCKSVQARLATAWGYVKAPPEQEPVAWYRDEDGIRIYYETKCWDDAIPLYTAPQPWEKFCDSNCVWTDHHPDCKLAEQEQEPVANEAIWLLTSEYNDYDQHGEYFEAVFIGKPTSKQIQKHCHVTEQGAVHILNGGGRVKYEDQWYNLRKEKAAHGIKGEA